MRFLCSDTGKREILEYYWTLRIEWNKPWLLEPESERGVMNSVSGNEQLQASEETRSPRHLHN